MADAEDHASTLSFKSIKASPDTLTKLVKRVRAMTLKLLPVQVEQEKISDPTSRFITPQVITAYEAAAGDFAEALPYCLLRARQLFIWDANRNPADYDENLCRAIACEVLARRIVHLAPPDRLYSIMSTRFRHLQRDGDKSDLTSALELAIDTHSTIFLSSSEAQHVINSLWSGAWIQKNNEENDIDYVPYDMGSEHTFWDHFDPTRLCVPRYQNFCRVTIWFVFLIVYSQAVRQPLERLDARHQGLDEWEVVLYVMALAFSIEEIHRLYKVLRYFTWRAFDFWTIVSVTTNTLLVTAFALRIAGMRILDHDGASKMHYKSFTVLSYVGPFIWMKLITVVDGYKYIGTMQICVARMLRESGIFFALLAILGLGFAQGLYALDAADGDTEHGFAVVNVLIQSLLQSPNFDTPTVTGTSLVLFYMWNVVTTVILLNVLISLFSSAYSDIVDNAEAQFLAFFAGKTIGMIRAPDSYVYPAPFNVIEVFLVAPFEPFLSTKAYAKLNRVVMTVVFFIPLTGIALWETQIDTHATKYMRDWFADGVDEGEEDEPSNQNPEVDEDGLTISRVPFAQLVKHFPNANMSEETNIINEIHSLRAKVEALSKKLEERPNGS